MSSQAKGRLVIISGPSGAGKTTVVKQLLEQCELPLVLSVSATTRQPRPGEKDGVHYHFLTPEQFQQKRDAGEFLECIEVFGRGFWYGTLSQTVTTSVKRGKWVVLEIDVEGAIEVQEQYPEAITIFLRPASLSELELRLRGRGTESEEKIQRRLEVARHELNYVEQYKYEVINDVVDQVVGEICEILTGEEQYS